MALDQDPAPGLGSSECHGRPRTFFFPGGEGAKTMSKERVFFFSSTLSSMFYDTSSSAPISLRSIRVSTDGLSSVGSTR